MKTSPRVQQQLKVPNKNNSLEVHSLNTQQTHYETTMSKLSPTAADAEMQSAVDAEHTNTEQNYDLSTWATRSID